MKKVLPQFIARPASLLYELVTRARNSMFDAGLLRSQRVGCPVISIGNLSLGGNSKTPITIFLVKELRRLGYEPFVVTRGYGGSESGPTEVLVDDSTVRIGDEPLLIRRSSESPVVVSRSRVAGIRFALAQRLGNVAVLDDGFQHRWLARDLDIVCLACDSESERQDLLMAKIFPEGPFREDLSRGLRRAHAIIYANRSGEAAGFDERVASIQEALGHSLPSYKATLRSEGVTFFHSGASLSPTRVVAFSAIAKPESFFRTLEIHGFQVVMKFMFRDHYQFTENDLSDISEHSEGLPVVCTEKDSVKLPHNALESLCVLRTSTVVEPKESFLRLVTTAIEKCVSHRPSGSV